MNETENLLGYYYSSVCKTDCHVSLSYCIWSSQPETEENNSWKLSPGLHVSTAACTPLIHKMVNKVGVNQINILECQTVTLWMW